MALNVGLTPRDAHNALYRDRIWRCSFEISISSVAPDATAAAEGFIRGNCDIRSIRCFIWCTARLQRFQGHFKLTGRNLQVDVLVGLSVLCVYRLPSHSKALVESDLLPYLEALFAPECSTFDQPMNTSMGKAVSIPGIVKPETCSSEGSVN